MPIKQISDRYIIPDANSTLRRYLSDEKTVDFLTTGELYFRRVDLFPKMDEVMFSFADKDWIRNQYKEAGISNWLELGNKEIENYENLKSKTYINCWNNDAFEKRYLWNTYLSTTNNGICIVTNTTSIEQALIDTHEDIQMVKVHYFDPISEPVGLFNGIRFFSRKIRDDRPDNEIRLIIQINTDDKLPKSLRLKINMNSISEIVLSPFREDCFKVLVENMLKDSSISVPLRESKLHNLS